MGRASVVALVAVDAGGLVSADFYGAEEGDDSHKGAVGAEESTPYVLDHGGEEDEGEDYGDPDG